MNVYSLAEGKKGKELSEARLEIVAFLRGEPEEWTSSVGELKGSEQLERMSFAEKYATPKFRGWLMDRQLSLEDFIDSHADTDRVEFAEMLGGGWVDDPSIVVEGS